MRFVFVIVYHPAYAYLSVIVQVNESIFAIVQSFTALNARSIRDIDRVIAKEYNQVRS
jgi:hypothetical protein